MPSASACSAVSSSICATACAPSATESASSATADASPAAVANHSGHHRLQMLTYAMAAGRHLHGPAPQATLYYLRAAVRHTYPLDEAAVADGERELAELARSLIAARRSGRFEIRRSATCDFCPYGALCGRC